MGGEGGRGWRGETYVCTWKERAGCVNGSTCEGIGRSRAVEEEGMLDSMNFSNTEPFHTSDRQQVKHKGIKIYVQYKLSVL